MVVHSESSAADGRMSQVRLSVRLKDGQTVEFSEELAKPVPAGAWKSGGAAPRGGTRG
jgi:hypothetical protein